MRPTLLRSCSSLVILAALLGFATLATTAQAEPDQDGYLPDEVSVKLFLATDLEAVAADYSLDPVPLDQFGSRTIYRMRIADGADPAVRAAELEADPRVEYAEPNFLGQTPEGRQRSAWAKGDDQGEYMGQWAPDMIRLPEAHTITRGAGIIVAVLDTGVDLTHPELVGHLLPGYDFVDLDSDPSEEGEYEVNAGYGHGTHVTGLVVLTAPEASILPVRVLDPEGVGNVWVLAEALAYAVDPDGDPDTNDGADVINMSLGTTQRTDLLAEVVALVTCVNDDDDDCLTPDGKGAVVVAAAGNSGARIREFPAAEQVPGALAIAASTITDTLATFSTYGRWVRVAAPGQDIVSTTPEGEYGTWSGTSMATPFAAGEAALIRAAYPQLRARQVTARMLASADIISALVSRRIDTAAALGLP